MIRRPWDPQVGDEGLPLVVLRRFGQIAYCGAVGRVGLARQRRLHAGPLKPPKCIRSRRNPRRPRLRRWRATSTPLSRRLAQTLLCARVDDGPDFWPMAVLRSTETPRLRHVNRTSQVNRRPCATPSRERPTATLPHAARIRDVSSERRSGSTTAPSRSPPTPSSDRALR